MKFLAVATLRADRTREELKAFREPGVRAIWALMRQGIVRHVDSRAEAPGVVLDLELPDRAAADKVLAELPAIRAEVMEITLLIECVPFTAIEALFRDDALSR